MERFRALAVIAILVFSSLPVSGIDSPSSKSTYVSEIPEVKINNWEDLPWWETTSRDLNRNGIVDWLEEIEDEYADLFRKFDVPDLTAHERTYINRFQYNMGMQNT